MTKETIRAWYKASRPPFYVATLIPLGIGGLTAAQDGFWNPLRWGVILLASFFVHLATNLSNEYFDYIAGADDGDAIGGTGAIQSGLITPKQLLGSLFLLYGLGLVCGLWLLWQTQIYWLIPVMLFAFFSSLFYTAPPVRYGYYGLGELFVGLNMGPVMVVGTDWVLRGSVNWTTALYALPVGIMVAMILYYQSLPDMETDRRSGKTTIAVRLGKSGAIWGYRAFFELAVLAIVGLVAAKLLHVVALGSVLTLFPAWKVDKMIRATEDWQDLHGRGGKVRMFYLINGLFVLLGIAC